MSDFCQQCDLGVLAVMSGRWACLGFACCSQVLERCELWQVWGLMSWFVCRFWVFPGCDGLSVG